jgi:hypothetical protein
MLQAPSRFDLVVRRLRQVANTLILWSLALVCLAAAIAYVVALVSGDRPDPPSLSPMLGVGGTADGSTCSGQGVARP